MNNLSMERDQLVIEAGRVFRFGIVGGSATIAYILAVVVGVQVFHLDPLVTSVAAHCAVIPISYFGHYTLTFRLKDNRHRLYGPRFLIVTIVGLFANIFVTSMVTVAGWPYWTAIALVLLFVPASSYLANRFCVFLPGLRS